MTKYYILPLSRISIEWSNKLLEDWLCNNSDPDILKIKLNLHKCYSYYQNINDYNTHNAKIGFIKKLRNNVVLLYYSIYIFFLSTVPMNSNINFVSVINKFWCTCIFISTAMIRNNQFICIKSLPN